MKIWQWVSLGIVGLISLIALLIYIVMHLTAPARELSREFFDAVRAADIDKIEAMAHPSLLRSEEYQNLKANLEPQAPFESYFFNSSSWENSNFRGEGTAWTADDCQSRLVIERSDGLVTRFSVYGSC